MQSNREPSGILQRIDQMVEELQLLRRQVAELLVREAEADAQTTVADTNSSRSHISSLEELYSLDFVKSEGPKTKAPVDDPFQESLLTIEPELGLNELFVPRGSEEILKSAFEPALHFHLIDHLTIADKFLFANELCFGDQSDLIDMLRDIERLSSWSQVESYLYQVRGFKKDEEAVQLLASFIKEHSR